MDCNHYQFFFFFLNRQQKMCYTVFVLPKEKKTQKKFKSGLYKVFMPHIKKLQFYMGHGKMRIYILYVHDQ